MKPSKICMAANETDILNTVLVFYYNNVYHCENTDNLLSSAAVFSCQREFVVVCCALFFLHYLEGSLINVIPYFIRGD